MKILLLTRRYSGTDGHSTVMNNVAYALLDKKIKPVIGALNFLQDPPSQIPKLKLRWPNDIIEFNNSVKEYDLIHNFQTLSSYTSLLTNKPYVFHYLGIGTSLQGINLKLSRIFTKRSIRKYLVSSAVSANELHQLIHVNSDIVPLAIHPSFFRTDFKPFSRNGNPQLLTVTRMMSYKKNEELLYGFKKFLTMFPDSHLRIVGTGPQWDDLQRLVIKLGVSSHVELLGQVQHSDLLPIYASCDIFISTSSKEAFPLPVIESMAVEKPVVISDIPIHQEIIRESKAGECYKSGDYEDLVNKLVMVLNDKFVYISNAKKYAQKWNLDNLGIKLTQIYDEILRN